MTPESYVSLDTFPNKHVLQAAVQSKEQRFSAT